MVPQRLRILYSEDDLDTREVTCLILEQEGFEVVCAESSNDVLFLAQQSHFDAYLLDTWTPLSGMDVCRLLREVDSYTPIVVYSAAAYDQDKRAAFAMGAQAYVAKPAEVLDLVDTIRSTIARHGPPLS